MCENKEISEFNWLRQEVLQFRDFIDRKQREMHLLRLQLIITIYGSYYPLAERERLIALKNFLISNGYALTRLVEDYPQNTLVNRLFRSREQRASTKSEYCLEFSDVNFFVFTHAGKCQGVSAELAYCRNSPNMIDRRWRSVVFDEIIDGRQATSFLDRGAVYPALREVKRISFKNDKALLALALKVANEFLFLLYPYLTQRAQIKGAAIGNHAFLK
jgi:hypothetical protein